MPTIAFEYTFSGLRVLKNRKFQNQNKYTLFFFINYKLQFFTRVKTNS